MWGLKGGSRLPPPDPPGAPSYLQGLLFLQLSNSSALLIFTARTDGMSCRSRPAAPLVLSVLVSQLAINVSLWAGVPWLGIARLHPSDLLLVWLYDGAWLLLLDILKLTVLRLPSLWPLLEWLLRPRGAESMPILRQPLHTDLDGKSAAKPGSYGSIP